MNLSIPENRILQPFPLRETERGFDLRAHVRFADALIQICHEDHRRNLIQQDLVSRLNARLGLRLPHGAPVRGRSLEKDRRQLRQSSGVPRAAGQSHGNRTNHEKTLGYLAVATIVAGIVVNFKDIVRYVRISTM